MNIFPLGQISPIQHSDIFSPRLTLFEPVVAQATQLRLVLFLSGHADTEQLFFLPPFKFEFLNYHGKFWNQVQNPVDQFSSRSVDTTWYGDGWC